MFDVAWLAKGILWGVIVAVPPTLGWLGNDPKVVFVSGFSAFTTGLISYCLFNDDKRRKASQLKAEEEG